MLTAVPHPEPLWVKAALSPTRAGAVIQEGARGPAGMDSGLILYTATVCTCIECIMPATILTKILVAIPRVREEYDVYTTSPAPIPRGLWLSVMRLGRGGIEKG